MSRKLLVILLCLSVLVFSEGCKKPAGQMIGEIAYSSDGVPISYSVYGKGDVNLIFSHGWGGDSRYWANQIPFFAKKYQVVTVDLAGHGHSGFGRKNYTMELFGQDIKAVADKVGAKHIIIIGHSMSGNVIAQAARLMPDRVIGIIGVDTLQNVESKYTQEQFEEFINPFKDDFTGKVDSFIREMFPKDADPELVTLIANDIAVTPPESGISALSDYFMQYVTGKSAVLFDELKIPVRAVNADLWPTDFEANRRHMVSFEAIIIEGVGHFLMLEQPENFNRQLDKVISDLIK